MTTVANRLAQLQKGARAAASHFPSHKPEFEFRVLWPTGYDELFAGIQTVSTPISELTDVALRHGRVLLHSGGGTGKSSIVHRLYTSLTRHGTLPILIDLRLDPIRRGEHAPTDDIDALLASAIPRTSEDELSIAAASGGVIVFIDGLNEVPRPLGDSILRELDGLAGRNPELGVIVTDRLVRRPVSERWRLGTIAPLNGAAGLESIAFWRDLAQRDPTSPAGRLSLHTRFLREHCSLSTDQIESVGRAALSAYRTQQSRLFSLDEFVDSVGSSAADRLLSAGVLERHDDFASFTHHLHHDLLAARAFAAQPALWDHAGFDALSFRASSFDALEVVAEATTAPELADLLVRAVYDWNPYGAAYVLSRGGAGRVSESLRLAVAAMLAERRFDLIRATVTDAEDALHLLGDDVPQAFRVATNRPEMVAAVREHVADADDEMTEWLDLFSREDGPLPDGALDALETEDSLLGWTAANVAHRLALQPEQLSRLRRDATSDPSLTIRWRAVHALGGHPGPDNWDAIQEVVRKTNEDHWVLRGAFRAAVEVLATAGDELKARAFDELSALLREKADRDPEDLLVRSFGRFAELEQPPAHWDLLVLPLTEDLWASAQTQDQQQQWELLALRLKTAQQARGS